MKILFLYTEIADYFLAGCVALIKKGVEVHVVRWPVNKEAPFQFTYPEGVCVYERSDISDQKLFELIDRLSPEILVCSGWVDKGYLKMIKKYKNKSTTVLTLDNHWRGDFKQRLASVLSPFFLKKNFSHCWVPGNFQYQYAQKLGFRPENILTGFYTCDFNKFHDQYLDNLSAKKINFPKRFIFVGRYYDFKGIQDLWNAFIQLQNESPNAWELWCLGTGDIEPFKHDKIKHFGFVQPKDLASFIKETGVFVLPSHFEPWGVVVHEFAAAGFPIISSDAVGARTAFVEDTINGYIYKAGQIEQLKVQLKKMMELDTNQLEKMASNSVEKAKMNTPELWADTLMSLLKK